MTLSEAILARHSVRAYTDPNEDGCNYPVEFSITELLDSQLDDGYSKEQKLSIIDGLILDIQDFRKKIEGIG